MLDKDVLAVTASYLRGLEDGFSRLRVAASAPSCASADIGRMYFDSTKKDAFLCNGEIWVTMSNAPLGTQANAAASCKDIFTDDPRKPTGDY